MQDRHRPPPLSSPAPPFSAAAHRRDPSGELDVFQASRYLSGYADATGFPKPPRMRETTSPPRAQPLHPQIPENLTIPKSSTTNAPTTPAKKPASTGGRLTRLLSSLFHHHGRHSRKEKKTASVESYDENGTSGTATPTSGFTPGDIPEVVAMWESSRRWTLNRGGAAMVVMEDMAEAMPRGRRGHLWRREEVEYGGGGGDDSDSGGDLLFELPVFDSTKASARFPANVNV